LDNAGGGCKFKDCVLVECKFHKCKFVPAGQNNPVPFLGTRSYGCGQIECIGLEELSN
jgi:hypothetical protein